MCVSSGSSTHVYDTVQALNSFVHTNSLFHTLKFVLLCFDVVL